MKKKIFGLLLGATFMFTLTAGVFTAFDAKADAPQPHPHSLLYILDEETPESEWCFFPGGNCFYEVWITD